MCEDMWIVERIKGPGLSRAEASLSKLRKTVKWKSISLASKESSNAHPWYSLAITFEPLVSSAPATALSPCVLPLSPPSPPSQSNPYPPMVPSMKHAGQQYSQDASAWPHNHLAAGFTLLGGQRGNMPSLLDRPWVATSTSLPSL